MGFWTGPCDRDDRGPGGAVGIIMKKAIVLSALILSVTGCPPGPAMPPPSPAQPPSMHGKARTMTQRGLGSASASNAAAANVPVQFQVELYQLSVPYGTVSRNEQFW